MGGEGEWKEGVGVGVGYRMWDVEVAKMETK